jgi:hypothetical protein
MKQMSLLHSVCGIVAFKYSALKHKVVGMNWQEEQDVGM